MILAFALALLGILCAAVPSPPQETACRRD
jgi:hypothetical protein